MAYNVKREQRARQKRYIDNEELMDSWVNGNRTYVRAKFRAMRNENKGVFLTQAKETMRAEDYDDLVMGLYK